MRQGEEVQHRGEDEDQGDQGPRAQVREHPVQQTGLPPGGCPAAASDGECPGGFLCVIVTSYL